MVLLVLCTGMFMAILDVNIINIAVVRIQAEFDTTLVAMTWAVDSYNLALAGFMLSSGVLADRYGARRIWLWGVVFFTGASLGCAVSRSITQLILLRLLQGTGAALFIPASFALMPIIWPENTARQRAIGLFGGIVAVAAAAGPVLGGVMIDAFSWRSIFLINIPTGLFAILSACRQLPRAFGNRGGHYDFIGQSTGLLGLACLSYVLIELPAQGWHDVWIRLAALAAFLSAVIFSGGTVRPGAHDSAPVIP
ncbi:MFS transporter [Acerihabitans sp. KWT182]|uniref:MFS transporter n=1 Tax=Acerihabitans sp. KWT182 TaxID=3157919 RepID=A0AAU7Q9V2_9GAMM